MAIQKLKANQPEHKNQVGVMIHNHLPYLKNGHKLLEMLETV
jgi:hypothetical protein